MARQLSLFEECPEDPFPHALFFALMPDETAAGDAQRLVERLRRHRMRLQQPLESHRLHVTLCGLGGFIGQMPPRLFAHADARERSRSQFIGSDVRLRVHCPLHKSGQRQQAVPDKASTQFPCLGLSRK